MPNRTITRMLMSLAVLVLMTAPAWARQVNPSKEQERTSQGVPEGVKICTLYNPWIFGHGDNYFSSFAVDVSDGLTHGDYPLAVVGQFSIHHAAHDTGKTILGGVRVGLFHTDNITLSAQGLGGYTKWGAWDFTATGDAVVDIVIDPKSALDIRVQSGFVYVQGTNSHFTGWTVGAGVEWSFGHGK